MTGDNKPIVYSGRDGTHWVEADPNETTAEPSFDERRVRACEGVYALVRGKVFTNATNESEDQK
jgi:hypothetical protein